MPASFEVFRITCGLFCATLCFRWKERGRSAMLSPKFVYLAPRHWDFAAPCCTVVRASCPMYYWTYVQFKESQGHARSTLFKDFRPCTFAATCVIVFIAGALLKCGDVESNPGPVSHGANGSGSDSTPSKNRSDSDSGEGTNKVMGDTGITTLVMFEKVMTELKDIKQFMHRFDERMSAVEHSVHDNSSGIKSLREENTYLKTKLTDMEESLDKLEIYSRRENFKLYGVPELPNEDFNSCKQAVVDLLNTCSDGDCWMDTDIVRAHRVGSHPRGTTNDNRRPRPLIVRMVSWEDKLSLIRSKELRGELKTRNIRIGDDLTMRQSQKLRHLRDQGQTAFFRGARLIVVQDRRDRTENEDVAARNTASDNNAEGNTYRHPWQRKSFGGSLPKQAAHSSPTSSGNAETATAPGSTSPSLGPPRGYAAAVRGVSADPGNTSPSLESPRRRAAAAPVGEVPADPGNTSPSLESPRRRAAAAPVGGVPADPGNTSPSLESPRRRAAAAPVGGVPADPGNTSPSPESPRRHAAAAPVGGVPAGGEETRVGGSTSQCKGGEQYGDSPPQSPDDVVNSNPAPSHDSTSRCSPDTAGSRVPSQISSQRAGGRGRGANNVDEQRNRPGANGGRSNSRPSVRRQSQRNPSPKSITASLFFLK